MTLDGQVFTRAKWFFRFGGLRYFLNGTGVICYSFINFSGLSSTSDKGQPCKASDQNGR